MEEIPVVTTPETCERYLSILEVEAGPPSFDHLRRLVHAHVLLRLDAVQVIRQFPDRLQLINDLGIDFLLGGLLQLDANRRSAQ